MTVKRDGFGRIKRQSVNHRDFRRKHAEGAAWLVETGARQVDSFKGRMLAVLRRVFS